MANLWNDVTNRVMRLAGQEAGRFRHDYIGTEHLLMALLRMHECAAAKALAARGIDLRHVRLESERVVHPGPEGLHLPRVLPLTPRARQALRHAVEAADALGKADVDTGHVLLGLVREGEGLASQVLRSLGVLGPAGAYEQLRDEVAHHNEAFQSGPSPAPVRLVEEGEVDVPIVIGGNLVHGETASDPARGVVWRRVERAMWRATMWAAPLSLFLLVFARSYEVFSDYGLYTATLLPAVLFAVLVGRAAFIEYRRATAAVRQGGEDLDADRFAHLRDELKQAIQTRFGQLDDAARQRLQAWDRERLAELGKRLPDAKSLGELGLGE
jgi:hypothetical protein